MTLIDPCHALTGDIIFHLCFECTHTDIVLKRSLFRLNASETLGAQTSNTFWNLLAEAGTNPAVQRTLSEK